MSVVVPVVCLERASWCLVYNIDLLICYCDHLLSSHHNNIISNTAALLTRNYDVEIIRNKTLTNNLPTTADKETL